MKDYGVIWSEEINDGEDTFLRRNVDWFETESERNKFLAKIRDNNNVLEFKLLVWR